MKNTLELFSALASLYRANGRLVIGYSAWLLIPPVISSIVFLLPQFSDEQKLIVLFLTMVMNMVLSVAVMILITLLTAETLNKIPFNSAALFQKCRTLLLPTIWVQLLVALAEVVGLIFFVIPGLIFFVWFSFAQIIVILEGARGVAALTQSRELIRGQFWSIFRRLFLGGIVFFGLYALIYILVSAPLAFSSLEKTFPQSPMAPFPTAADQLMTSAAQVLTMPLFVMYLTLLYREAKLGKKP
jgi:hypothetical protein